MSHKHPNLAHKRASIDWARTVLWHKTRYVILDTETTGSALSELMMKWGSVMKSKPEFSPHFSSCQARTKKKGGAVCASPRKLRDSDFTYCIFSVIVIF